MKQFNIGYFSHSKQIFNTKEEQEIYEHISLNFNGHLICPNKHFGKYKPSDYYLNTVSVVDVLFVYEHNKHVTEGVIREIRTAADNGKSIVVCRKKDDQILFYELMDMKINPYKAGQRKLAIVEVGNEIPATGTKLFESPF